MHCRRVTDIRDVAIDEGDHATRIHTRKSRRARCIRGTRIAIPCHAKQFTWSRFVQNVTEEPDGAIQMLMGFVTLGGELLVGLEKATGNSAPWHLQQIAAKYA